MPPVNSHVSAYPRPISIPYTPRDSVWLFITTLYHRRFIEDAIHVVGLPSGSHVRLRYRQDYIDNELWQSIKNQGYSGHSIALISLAATASISGESLVHPVRKATITSARCEGSVMIVDVVLREFLFNLPSSSNSFWAECQLIARNLPSQFGGSVRNGVFLQRLSSPPQALSAAYGVAAWEKTASAFFEIVEWSDSGSMVPFLYYVTEPVRSVRLRIDERGALSLEAGCTVTLEVHTIVGLAPGSFKNALGEILLDLSHPAATFLSSRRFRIDSRRDVKAIQVVSPPVFRRAHGHLSVRMVVFEYGKEGVETLKAGEDRTEVVVSRYDYPLRVGRWIPTAASILVAAAAALAAYKPSSEPSSWRSFVLPGFVFVFAVFGLMLGLRKDGK